MRLFFTGPKILGIRPGISLDPAKLMGSRSGRSDRRAAGVGFVYVIRGEHGRVKVGSTEREPRIRLAELSTGSAFPLEFAYVGATSGNAESIEFFAHDILDRYHVHLEWFNCAPEIAVAAIASAAYKLGHPITEIQPDQAAQIIQMAARSQPNAPHAGWFMRCVQVMATIIIASLTALWVLFVSILIKS
jgi:hypothetical protein